MHILCRSFSLRKGFLLPIVQTVAFQSFAFRLATNTNNFLGKLHNTLKELVEGVIRITNH